ncbi:DUF2061 domain-containing protein [Stieleria varia]|uniref:DUF2061 domain-containing protein n=1 Tax=Stieleria varia TaxID=2528005 RepID=A0A5C6AW99_9BACT|nr:DUF2061 domain-containing protein [Stieleria varia]TWU04295.1 hypothetical protein Pla52n_23340 [Stieleria varia]
MTEPNLHFQETKARSLTKTVSWRCVAVLNSFLILTMKFSDQAFVNALAMNVTGFVVFYFFERIWNRVKWGRIPSGGLTAGGVAAGVDQPPSA